jgi:DNA-binding NarL/FixJ family response regulator
MNWTKQFLHWINTKNPKHLLILKLDLINAQYLAQLARSKNTTPQKIAHDLLENALVEQKIAETQLDHWRALTPRQQQIAALACLNFTNRQIAARLNISPQTVKAHMRNLLHRFDLHSKTELRQALENWDFSEWI